MVREFYEATENGLTMNAGFSGRQSMHRLVQMDVNEMHLWIAFLSIKLGLCLFSEEGEFQFY